MWEDNNYCWVVMCKKQLVSSRQNLFYSIESSAETDVKAAA